MGAQFWKTAVLCLSVGCLLNTSKGATQTWSGIVAATPPVITGATLVGGNLVIVDTNGKANAGYTVLTSTNLTLPLAGWSVATTGSFSGNGRFTNTLSAVSADPKRFYLLRLP